MTVIICKASQPGIKFGLMPLNINGLYALPATIGLINSVMTMTGYEE